MPQILADSLMTLEAYSKARPDIRKAAIAHKKIRKVFVGEHVLMQFEDEQTIRYQVQEMLHAEKTFNAEGIQDELNAYNPLVPEGKNWKATQMIEYTDVEERNKKLVELKGLERQTYVQIANFEKVYAIADEDMPRENEEKTSAIHFMRFELNDAMITAVKQGESVAVGIDLPAYNFCSDAITAATQASLTEDFA